MLCPTCGRPMVMLFVSAVCNFCSPPKSAAPAPATCRSCRSRPDSGDGFCDICFPSDGSGNMVRHSVEDPSTDRFELGPFVLDMYDTEYLTPTIRLAYLQVGGSSVELVCFPELDDDGTVMVQAVQCDVPSELNEVSNVELGWFDTAVEQVDTTYYVLLCCVSRLPNPIELAEDERRWLRECVKEYVRQVRPGELP